MPIEADAEQRIILAIKAWRQDLVANTKAMEALRAELKKRDAASERRTKLIVGALEEHGALLEEVAELLEDEIEDAEGDEDDDEDGG